MGLFVVQLLLVAYQFTFVADAGRADSNARATRIPDSWAIGHLLLSSAATLLWLGWRIFGDRAWAWTAFGVLVIAAAIGGLIAQRALGMPSELAGTSSDPADLRTAESRVPEVAAKLLVLVTVVLVVLVLLVAVGVFN